MTSNELATVGEQTIATAAPVNTLMEKGIAKLRAHAELKAMAYEYADFITKTGGCPDIYRGKPFDATAAIIRGTALGFDPDGALEAFFVIHGKVGMYSRAMIAVAENVGCRVWEVEASDQSVTWSGTRPGDSKVESVTWTYARAEQAGYVKSNAKYRSNPAEMLRAKCQSELARIIAPGALMGMVSEVEKHEVSPIQAKSERVAPVRGVAGVRAKLGVTDEPAPASAEEQPPVNITEQTVEPASDAELADLFDLLKDAGHETAEQQRAYASRALGREVQGARDLTSDDVFAVVSTLTAEMGGEQR